MTRLRLVGIAAFIVVFTILSTLSPVKVARAASSQGVQRVALLPFWAFDEAGNVVPHAKEVDIARLATLLPRSIADRMSQSGEFEVFDAPLLDARRLLPTNGAYELERVENLLATGEFEQVITGSVALLERTVVTSLRRFTSGANGAELAGAAVVRSNSPSDVINNIDILLAQAFPPESEVVIRPISRVVVVPSVLRLPIGAAAAVQAYAIDDLGRPLPNVNLVYQSTDESRATVDSTGHVRGISPGRTTISVQPIGRPSAAGTNWPSVDVNVVGPNLGMRIGSSIVAGESPLPRVGLRLSPGYELKARTSTQELPTTNTNPVNYLTTFFGALLGNEMLTLSLDVVPSQDISVSLDAMQRTAGGYFGTGIGVTVPLVPDGPNGINLRLAFGTHLPFAIGQSTKLPIELTADFLLGSGPSSPMARMGLAFGLDLFQ